MENHLLCHDSLPGMLGEPLLLPSSLTLVFTWLLSHAYSPPPLSLLDIFKCPFLNLFSRGTNILADGLSCVLWWLTLELAVNWMEHLCPIWDRNWPLLMEATPCVPLPTLGHLTPRKQETIRKQFHGELIWKQTLFVAPPCFHFNRFVPLQF